MNEERRKTNQIIIAVIEERLNNLMAANDCDHKLIVKKLDYMNGVKSDIRWLTWAVRSLIVAMIGFAVWLIELSVKK